MGALQFDLILVLTGYANKSLSKFPIHFKAQSLRNVLSSYSLPLQFYSVWIVNKPEVLRNLFSSMFNNIKLASQSTDIWLRENPETVQWEKYMGEDSAVRVEKIYTDLPMPPQHFHFPRTLIFKSSSTSII